MDFRFRQAIPKNPICCGIEMRLYDEHKENCNNYVVFHCHRCGKLKMGIISPDYNVEWRDLSQKPL